jgi:hypothetical protein
MMHETMLGIARQAIGNAFRYDADREQALRWFDGAAAATAKLAEQAAELERLAAENERLASKSNASAERAQRPGAR